MLCTSVLWMTSYFHITGRVPWRLVANAASSLQYRIRARRCTDSDTRRQLAPSLDETFVRGAPQAKYAMRRCFVKFVSGLYVLDKTRHKTDTGQ